MPCVRHRERTVRELVDTPSSGNVGEEGREGEKERWVGH